MLHATRIGLIGLPEATHQIGGRWWAMVDLAYLPEYDTSSINNVELDLENRQRIVQKLNVAPLTASGKPDVKSMSA